MCAEVGARAFLAPSGLRGRSKSKKKERGSARKKKREKRESNESGQKPEFSLFPPFAATLETRFQNPKPLGRRYSKGLEQD
jgi:hypothetical protein